MLKDFMESFRLFNHDVKMYLLTSSLLGFSYFGFVSVLLNLYLLRLGYEPAFIGLVNAGAPIAFAACSIPAGMLGKRFGWRRTITLGITLLALSIGLMPLAELLPQAWRNTGFVITRLMTGLGFALYQVNTNPYLVAVTTPEERNQVFSLQVGLLPAAGFLGSIISGLLPTWIALWLDVSMADPAPFRYPLILASLLLLPAAFALMTTSDVENHEGLDAPMPDRVRGPPAVDSMLPKATSIGERLKIRLGNTPLLIIAVLALSATLRMTGEGAARTFFNVYLDDSLGVSTAEIGFITAIGQGIAGPAALVGPLLVMRIGKISTVTVATLGISMSLVIMALASTGAGVGIGFIGVLGMLSITRAITNVVYMEIVKTEWRSLTSGVTSAAMGIGFASMTLGGGFIITLFGYRPLFLLGAAAVFCSALLFWLYFRTPRGEYAKAPEGILVTDRQR